MTRIIFSFVHRPPTNLVKSCKDPCYEKTGIAGLRPILEIKAPAKPKATIKKELPVPATLAAALKKNSKAATAFEEFSPSHRKEYIEWINEAKTEETRTKRVDTTIEWLTEGKSRNWKYVKK